MADGLDPKRGRPWVGTQDMKCIFPIYPKSCHWNGSSYFTVVLLDRLAYLRWSPPGPINRQKLLGMKLPMEPLSDASFSSFRVPPTTR